MHTLFQPSVVSNLRMNSIEFPKTSCQYLAVKEESRTGKAWGKPMYQTLEGPFSAVSRPMFAEYLILQSQKIKLYDLLCRSRDISKQQTENIPSTSSSELDLPGSFGDLSRPISLSLSKHTRKEMKMNTQEKRSK